MSEIEIRTTSKRQSLLNADEVNVPVLLVDDRHGIVSAQTPRGGRILFDAMPGGGIRVYVELGNRNQSLAIVLEGEAKRKFLEAISPLPPEQTALPG